MEYAARNPRVARLVISRFICVAPEHKLCVIAPTWAVVSGSKIFIYPEEVVWFLWASRVVVPSGEVDLRALGEFHHRRASPRSTSHSRKLALDGDGKITALMKVHTTANLGKAYMSMPSLRLCRRFLYATLLYGTVRLIPDHLLGG